MTRYEWSRRKNRSGHFVSRGMRFAIYLRDQFKCVYCKRSYHTGVRALLGVGLTLDHIWPRAYGGTHAHDNLVTACVRCNALHGSRAIRASSFVDDKGERVAGRQKSLHARVARQLHKPIDLAAGRWLANLVKKEFEKLKGLS